MRNAKRFFWIFVLGGGVLLNASLAAQDAAYIDHIDGIDEANPGIIRAGVPISVVINFRIESGNLTGCTNGFSFSSPDGATWTPISTTANPALATNYLDGGVFLNYFSNDGSGTDTVGFGAFKLFMPGVPQGYDGWVMTHTFTIDPSSVGKTFVIDTTYFPPGGTWLFTTTGGSSVPTWSGRREFTIVPCCIGLRGNADGGAQDTPLSVTDLDYLINWLFFAGPDPICWLEADLDGDGNVNIADIGYLVDYFWLDGPAPVACP